MIRNTVKNCLVANDKGKGRGKNQTRCRFCYYKHYFNPGGYKDVVFIHDHIISQRLIGEVTNKLTHIVHPSRIAHIFMLKSLTLSNTDYDYVRCANNTLLFDLSITRPKIVLACGNNILSYLAPNKALVRENKLNIFEYEDIKFHYMKFTKFEIMFQPTTTSKNLILNPVYIKSALALFNIRMILLNELGIDISTEA